MWNADTGQPIGEPLTGHTESVWSVAFSPDGHRVVSGGFDKTVRVWDADTGQPIGQPMTGHTDVVSTVAFSPDGHRIVSGSWDQTLRLWNADTGQRLGPPMTGHTDVGVQRGVQPRRAPHHLGQRGQNASPVGRGHPPRHRRTAAAATPKG